MLNYFCVKGIEFFKTFGLLRASVTEESKNKDGAGKKRVKNSNEHLINFATHGVLGDFI